MNEESVYTCIDGVRLHYRKFGNGPVPVVFLHGFASSSTTWLDIADFFSADHFSLFFLDLKGFGLSAKPKDRAYSLEDQAALVRAFIVDRGFPSLILVGHSMGGAVALLLAIDAAKGTRPYTLHKLVLIASAAYPQRIPRFFRRLRSPLGIVFFKLLPTRLLVQGAMERVFFDKSVITPERFARYACYFRGKGTAHALRETVRAIDPEAFGRIGESYQRLRLPVFLVWGDHDRNVRLSVGLRLHGDIPGSLLTVLENCGHSPHEERPEETSRAILDFLGET